jgi:hypothetical protein
MAPRLKWAVELISTTNIVPRLEDHLIDELFYQEDEIGEFRHTAFMVECGLEEDPPDGPDVAPVPWGEMLLKQQQQQQQEKEQNKIVAADENVVVKGGRPRKIEYKDKNKSNRNNDSDSHDGVGWKKGKRELPNRSRSTDDIETLAIELTSSPKARHNNKLRSTPNRSNSVPLDMYAVNGEASPSSSSYVQFSPGSLTGKKLELNRRPEKRIPDIKTSSSDDSASSSTRERRLGSQTSSRPKRITPMRGMLTTTRSGTCHEMAAAATKAKEKLNAEKERNGGSNSSSSSTSRAKRTVPVRGKLVATRSGTPREMATAATKAKKKLNAEKEKKKEYESVADFPPASPSVRERRRSIESAAHVIKPPFVSEQRNSIESIECKQPDKSARPAPLIRSLVTTKSGTVHGARKQTRDTTDKKNEDEPSRIVYKNGKKTVLRRLSSISKKDTIRQRNSLSDSSFSDDNFLGDIVPESDDESVGRSDISVSTCGSEIDDHLSPQKEQKAYVPKSIPQSLKKPVRKRSLSKKELLDEDILGSSSKSFKSIDKAKKEKKKGKKKKEKEGLDLHKSFSSPISSPIVTEHSRKNHNESTQGDLRPGCYPSPSSIRTQNRKTLSTTKSTSTEPQKDNVQSPSIIEIEQREGQARVPAAFACSIDLLAATKKRRETDTTTSYVKPIREHSRPDDWLGSGQKAKRSWRVKTKPSENTP